MTILAVGFLLVGVLVASGVDDPPSSGAQDVAAEQAERTSSVKAPAWKKAIDAWKARESHDTADNYFCLVCHINYEDEQLVKVHRPMSVGCETCHGISEKHSEDEDNITPPEVMFHKTRILPFCLSCHDRQELLEEEKHEELFSSNAKPDKTCTDCHGSKHRLRVRTRRWDKDTGKLIWCDGVRMMETNFQEDQ